MPCIRISDLEPLSEQPAGEPVLSRLGAGPRQREAYRQLRQDGQRQVDLVVVLEKAGQLVDYLGLLNLPPEANAAEVRLAVLTTPWLRTRYQACAPRGRRLDGLEPFDIPAPPERD